MMMHLRYYACPCHDPLGRLLLLRVLPYSVCSSVATTAAACCWLGLLLLLLLLLLAPLQVSPSRSGFQDVARHAQQRCYTYTCREVEHALEGEESLFTKAGLQSHAGWEGVKVQLSTTLASYASLFRTRPVSWLYNCRYCTACRVKVNRVAHPAPFP